MALVEIDKELSEEIQKFVDADKIEYPSFKNFVNKVLKEKVESLKNDINTDSIN